MSLDQVLRDALWNGWILSYAAFGDRTRARRNLTAPDNLRRNDFLLLLNGIYPSLVQATERPIDYDVRDEELRSALGKLAHALQQRIFEDGGAKNWPELADRLLLAFTAPTILFFQGDAKDGTLFEFPFAEIDTCPSESPTRKTPSESTTSGDLEARRAAVDLFEMIFGALRFRGPLDQIPMVSGVMAKLQDGINGWFRTYGF
ncbi:MAG: hypothetical protein U0136_05910 [Bdellovibrionota bacterium]